MDKKLFDKKTQNEIQKLLNYKFRNKDLINKAFTHSSFAHDEQLKNNERLEFLGDSVLQLCTTKYLFDNFNFQEGILSKMRSYIVSTKNLSKAITDLKIIDYLKIKNSPKRMMSIKADLFEAIVGAIYIDGGYKSACRFIRKKLDFNRERFKELSLDTKDYKTQLQELIQSQNLGKFEYKTKRVSGPSHNPHFKSTIILSGKVIGSGKGHNKKEAETSAAKEARDNLNKAIDKAISNFDDK